MFRKTLDKVCNNDWVDFENTKFLDVLEGLTILNSYYHNAKVFDSYDYKEKTYSGDAWHV